MATPTSYTLNQIRNDPSIRANLRPLTIKIVQKPPQFTKLLAFINGGSNKGHFSDGDLLVGYSPGLSILPIGAPGQVLTITQTGTVGWTNNLSDAITNLANYDLINNYSFYQAQASSLLSNFNGIGTTIFQKVQNTVFATTDINNISASITVNANALANNDAVIAHLSSITNTAINQINDIFSELVDTNSTITTITGELTDQATSISGLFNQVTNLNTQISGFYTNVTSDISFKNLIVNGDFQVWQRATSFGPGIITQNYITADHWFHSSDTGGFVTSNLLKSFVNNVYANTLQLSLSGATNGLTLINAVEDATSLQNTFATLSFFVRCDTNQTLNITIVQNFGIGGSTAITLGNSTCTTTTSWVRYTMTVSVPDISTYYIGSQSYFEILIKTENTFTNLQLAFVQFEGNINATNFTSRQYQLELMLCKRYYETGDNMFSGHATGSLGVSVTHSYSVTKFTLPNLTAQVTGRAGFTTIISQGFLNDINNGSVKVTKDINSGYGYYAIQYQALAEII